MNHFYQTAEERDIFWRKRGNEWCYAVGSAQSGFDAFDTATTPPNALERALEEESDPDLARELFIDGYDAARAEMRKKKRIKTRK